MDQSCKEVRLVLVLLTIHKPSACCVRRGVVKAVHIMAGDGRRQWWCGGGEEEALLAETLSCASMFVHWNEMVKRCVLSMSCQPHTASPPAEHTRVAGQAASSLLRVGEPRRRWQLLLSTPYAVRRACLPIQPKDHQKYDTHSPLTPVTGTPTPKICRGSAPSHHPCAASPPFSAPAAGLLRFDHNPWSAHDTESSTRVVPAGLHRIVCAARALLLGLADPSF